MSKIVSVFLGRQNNMYPILSQTLRDRHITLVAVSKTHPPERILDLYSQGQRVFGENRVQEMVAKYQVLPKDIEWHLIGHLQTNKVKDIAPFVRMIHSVDSLRLLREINKQALKAGRTIDCLLQFHIADEETKFGLDEAEASALVRAATAEALQAARICGVMGMATLTEDTEKIRAEFRQLRAVFLQLKNDFFPNDPHFREISMGMSGDWEIAAEEGSTMVRIGSLLFGQRH